MEPQSTNNETNFTKVEEKVKHSYTEEDNDSDSDSMPPLEDIKKELEEVKSLPAHGKNIKGVEAENDNEEQQSKDDNSDGENDVTMKDGWVDILNNGDLRKKVLYPGPMPNRPPRGSKVTIRIVTHLYVEPSHEVQDVKEEEDKQTIITAVANGPIIEAETYNRFTLVVGDNDLHQGLDLLLPLMDNGEIARLLVKPRFAYGPVGNKSIGIPEDATLDIEVQLLDYVQYHDSPYGNSPLGGSPDPEPGEPNPVVLQETLEERIRFGNYKKLRGNFWFERGEYSLAIQCYRGAIRYLDASELELELVDRFKTNKCDESPNVKEEEQQKFLSIEELIDKRAQTFNNLAATQMKLQAYDQALRSVEDSLLLRPQNVKALYRRAKIRTEKGEIELAIEDLKKASSNDPNSEAIALELDRLNKILVRQLNAQRQMYRRMMQNSNTGHDNKISNNKNNNKSKNFNSSASTNGLSTSSSSSSLSSKFSLFKLPKISKISATAAAIVAVLIPSLYIYLK